jgi:hypothetical protein
LASGRSSNMPPGPPPGLPPALSGFLSTGLPPGAPPGLPPNFVPPFHFRAPAFSDLPVHQPGIMMGPSPGPPFPVFPFGQFPPGHALGPPPSWPPYPQFGYPPMPGLPPPPWPHIPRGAQMLEETPAAHATTAAHVPPSVSVVEPVPPPALPAATVSALSITSSATGRQVISNIIHAQHRTGRNGRRRGTNSTSNNSLRHQQPNINRPLSDACRTGSATTVSDPHTNNNYSPLTSNGANVPGGTAGSGDGGHLGAG